MLMLWPIILGFALSPTQISGQLSGLEARAGCSDNLAYSSNGRMAFGLNADGQMDALRWPGSAGPDHLSYRSNLCAESVVSASTTHKIAPNMGLFFGLAKQGQAPQWMQHLGPFDDVSTTQIAPLNPGSTTLRVSHQDGAVHWVVEYRPVPDRDLLMIRVEVSAEQDLELPDRLWLLANLAPQANINSAGDSDWLGDAPGSGNDSAALFSERADAFVHFAINTDAVPEDFAQRFAALGEDVQSHEQADLILQDLIENETRGRFFVIGADQASLSYQIGREDPLDQARPQDAYFDAQDAQLQRQAGVMGQLDAALVFPLQDQPADDDNVVSQKLRVVTMFLAMGENVGAALEQLEGARLQGFVAIEESVRAEESRWLRSIALPNDDASEVQALALDSIRRVSAAADIYTGAMPAAVGAQPGLTVDCPAWSVFMEQALDLSGQEELVSAHNIFLATAQNDQVQQNPGTWASCYYANARPSAVASASGQVAADYSLDATAMVIWSWQKHLQHLAKMGEGEQVQNLKDHLQTQFDLALSALLNCKDVDNDLACSIACGWGELPEQNLYASISLSLGLQAASLWLADDDTSDPRIELIQARLDLLHRAIWDHFVDGNGDLVGENMALAWALVDAELWLDRQQQRQNLFEHILEYLTLYQQQDWSFSWPIQVWSLSQIAQGKELNLNAGQQTQLKNVLYKLAANIQQNGMSPGALWRMQNEVSDDVNEDISWQVQTRLGRPFSPVSAALYTSIVSVFGRRAPANSQGPIDACSCKTTMRPVTKILFFSVLIFTFLWRRRAQGGRG